MTVTVLTQRGSKYHFSVHAEPGTPQASKAQAEAMRAEIYSVALFLSGISESRKTFIFHK